MELNACLATSIGTRTSVKTQKVQLRGRYLQYSFLLVLLLFGHSIAGVSEGKLKSLMLHPNWKKARRAQFIHTTPPLSNDKED
jgi:hypothetical protein